MKNKTAMIVSPDVLKNMLEGDNKEKASEVLEKLKAVNKITKDEMIAVTTVPALLYALKNAKKIEVKNLKDIFDVMRICFFSRDEDGELAIAEFKTDKEDVMEHLLQVAKVMSGDGGKENESKTKVQSK